MAQPTNTYSTNDMAGIREDLSDIIYDVSPTDTPFLSMAGRAEATNTYHEWQVDSLAAAATNYVIEGDDATTDAGVSTTRRGNYTNISDKVARVTGTARAVNTAGRADEMDYQVLKRAKELKRDMEKVLLDNNARVSGDDTTARECAGAPAWLFTNTDFGGGGADGAGDGTTARTDGTQRAFTEDQVKTVMQLCWEEGGMPDTLMVGSFNRQVASSFTAGKSGFQKAEDSTLHATYDVYESDFGQLKMIPNRFMRSRDALILQMDMWKVAFMPGRNMVTTDLAKTGDTDRKQILAEYTLEASNEKANGGVFDLTTS
jgi:hypothetical protein